MQKLNYRKINVQSYVPGRSAILEKKILLNYLQMNLPLANHLNPER